MKPADERATVQAQNTAQQGRRNHAADARDGTVEAGRRPGMATVDRSEYRRCQ